MRIIQERKERNDKNSLFCYSCTSFFFCLLWGEVGKEGERKREENGKEQKPQKIQAWLFVLKKKEERETLGSCSI